MTYGKGTILVVDDCEAILEALETLLGDDFQVVVATDGNQALSVLEGVSPKMILLDVMMPGMNGIQFLRELRQMSLKTRIVIITATALDEVFTEINSLGVDGMLRKPFDIAQVMDITSELTGVAA